VRIAPNSNGPVHSQPLVYLYVQIEQGPKIECRS